MTFALTWLRACSCVLLVALASCAAERYEFEDHPLAGKIWDVAAGRPVVPAVVLEHAVAARFVLLGETHDNREHHRIQARILEALARSGRHPALVMEQFDREQQGGIDEILHAGGAVADRLPRLAALMRKGWDWPAYEPLAEIALRVGLPVVAANLSRAALREVSRGGFAALGAGEDERLALARVWSPARQQQMLREIHEGHCGRVPDTMLEALVRAQRARDAVMADTLLEFGKPGAVAIVGRGHARRDMAVPLYLAARAPQARVLTVGIVEVDRATDPAAYARGPLGELYDYVWFTPRVRRPTDPCDAIPRPGRP